MTSSLARRTNSLGRATDDCFACQRLGNDAQKRCDRQRPRCNVCTEAGRVCSGYRQHFQWQGGATRARRTFKRKRRGSKSTTSHTVAHDTATPSVSYSVHVSARERSFEFVQEQVAGDYTDLSFSRVVQTQMTDRHMVGTSQVNSPASASLHAMHHEETSRLPNTDTAEDRPQRVTYIDTMYGLVSSPSRLRQASNPYNAAVAQRPPSCQGYHAPHDPIPAQSHNAFCISDAPPRSLANTPTPRDNARWQARIDGKPFMDHTYVAPSALTISSTEPPHFVLSANSGGPVGDPGTGRDADIAAADPDDSPTPTRKSKYVKQGPPQPHDTPASAEWFQTSLSARHGQQAWHGGIVSPVASDALQSTSSVQGSVCSETAAQKITGNRRAGSIAEPQQQVDKEVQNDDERVERSNANLIRHQEIGVYSSRMCPPISPSVFSWHSLSAYEPGSVQHFDRFVCPVPVTINRVSIMNPYRETLPYIHEIPALKHAVLATAIQHRATNSNSRPVNNVEDGMAVKHHKTTSLSLLRDGLNNVRQPDTDGALITTLILILLEAMQNAKSDWSMHFKAVARLLEERGGVSSLVFSTVLKPQMAMLIWYDMSIALVGQKECCIPSKYVHALANCNDQYWTFFSLVGCPGELCRIVHRFCTLAATPGYTMTLLGAGEVAGLEQQLHEFQPLIPEALVTLEPGMTPGPTSHMVDETHERMHSANVWRWALLLYSARVFRRLPGHDVRVQSFARRVIDHARVLPLARDGAAKQLLLPLLLAGSDEKNPMYKQYVVDYMVYWANETRFKVWDDSREVLLSVWHRQEQNPESDFTLLEYLHGGEWMFG